MDETPQAAIAEFPASLSKEEFFCFQKTLSRIVPGGRVFRGGRGFSLVMVVLCAVLLLTDFLVAGETDWTLMVLFLLITAVELLFFFLMPRRMERKWAEQYAFSLFEGHSYDGIITVEEDRIVKTTADLTTTISYASCPLYIETAELLIFCGREQHNIVIPARCLTAADAACLRDRAMAGVPAPNRRLIGRLIPLAAERMPAPATVPCTDPPVLAQASFAYTPEEAGRIANDKAFDTFRARLPFVFLLAVLIAFLAYSYNESWLLPAFLIGWIAVAAWTWFSGRSKIKNGLLNSGKTAVDWSDAGMRITAGGRQLRIPWLSITRAVDCRDRVEFYVETRLISVPKRAIEELDALQTLADTHLPPRT